MADSGLHGRASSAQRDTAVRVASSQKERIEGQDKQASSRPGLLQNEAPTEFAAAQAADWGCDGMEHNSVYQKTRIVDC